MELYQNDIYRASEDAATPDTIDRFFSLFTKQPPSVSKRTEEILSPFKSLKINESLLFGPLYHMEGSIEDTVSDVVLYLKEVHNRRRIVAKDVFVTLKKLTGDAYKGSLKNIAIVLAKQTKKGSVLC